MSFENRLREAIAAKTTEKIELLALTGFDPMGEIWTKLLLAFNLDGEEVQPSAEFFDYCAKNYANTPDLTRLFAAYHKDAIELSVVKQLL